MVWAEGVGGVAVAFPAGGDVTLTTGPAVPTDGERSVSWPDRDR